MFCVWWRSGDFVVSLGFGRTHANRSCLSWRALACITSLIMRPHGSCRIVSADLGAATQVVRDAKKKTTDLAIASGKWMAIPPHLKW